MESFSLGNEDPFDIFDKLNIVIQTLENVLQHILRLVEKFEEFLKIFSSMSRATPNTAHNKAASKSNAIAETVEHPTVTGMQEIAGLSHIKSLLNTLVILPRNQPQLFQNRAVGNCILLYGPPGTGKTKLVHALSAESGAVLHSISVGSLLSSYVGETERNIQQIFNHLRSSKDFCILFIDEIDGLCRKRTSSEHEYSRRIKTELMCQMNKMNIYPNTKIVGATNCPWDLDSAILRRFQKCIYVPLPDSEERLELFQLLTKDIHIIQTPEEFAELIKICEGYSSSDICRLVEDALDIPLTELQGTTLWNKTPDGFYEPFMANDPSINNIENILISQLDSLPPFTVRARPVTVADFIDAAKNIQVTVSPEDIGKYEKFRNSK